MTRRLFGECLFYGYPYLWDDDRGRRIHDVVQIHVDGFDAAGACTLLTVGGDDPSANNTWERRGRVTLRRRTANRSTLELPPHSISALLLRTT